MELTDDRAVLKDLRITHMSKVNLIETQLAQEILDEPDSDEEQPAKQEEAQSPNSDSFPSGSPSSPKPMYAPSYFRKIGLLPMKGEMDH